jgi:hypothetical protein
MVAAMNRLDLDEQHLREHLFGVERRAFPVGLRSGLAEIQGGRCFYCAQPLGPRGDVDHFVPWARYPNDAVENLVLADPACNGHKRDRVAGSLLLERWGSRLRDHGSALVGLATTTGWVHARSRSVGLVRSVYAHLPAGTPLWGGPGQIESADAHALAAALAGIA